MVVTAAVAPWVAAYHVAFLDRYPWWEIFSALSISARSSAILLVVSVAALGFLP